MLRHTFCHAPGVGVGTERALWDQGVHAWDDVDAAALSGRAWSVRDTVAASRRALEAGDARYFGRALPPRELWRLFSTFRGRVAYLDIETTGLTASDEVTTIAVFDGRRVRHYVAGRNLDDFEREMGDYDVLVTYNGRGFDVPMLRRALGVHLDHAHIDLMYVLRGLGLRGGLKAIERRLGYGRTDLADVDGYFAVLLWREWRRTRDEDVLETLVAYNVQDVLTLEPLMVHAHNEKVRETPFSHLALEVPPLFENPFRAHRHVIERVRAGFAA